MSLQPGLQNYQERNKPEYIQKKERARLEKESIFMQHEPPAKKRAGSVEPLERPLSSSPLPELPDDLKHKQVYFLNLQTNFFNV